MKELRNVSVAFGRDATIDCEVSNAENYKVIEFLILLPLDKINDIGIKIYSVNLTRNLYRFTGFTLRLRPYYQSMIDLSVEILGTPSRKKWKKKIL